MKKDLLVSKMFSIGTIPLSALVAVFGYQFLLGIISYDLIKVLIYVVIVIIAINYALFKCAIFDYDVAIKKLERTKNSYMTSQLLTRFYLKDKNIIIGRFKWNIFLMILTTTTIIIGRVFGYVAIELFSILTTIIYCFVQMIYMSANVYSATKAKARVNVYFLNTTIKEIREKQILKFMSKQFFQDKIFASNIKNTSNLILRENNESEEKNGILPSTNDLGKNAQINDILQRASSIEMSEKDIS